MRYRGTVTTSPGPDGGAPPRGGHHVVELRAPEHARDRDGEREQQLARGDVREHVVAFRGRAADSGAQRPQAVAEVAGVARERLPGHVLRVEPRRDGGEVRAIRRGPIGHEDGAVGLHADEGEDDAVDVGRDGAEVDAVVHGGLDGRNR